MKYQKILSLVIGSAILSGCSLLPTTNTNKTAQSTNEQVKQAEKLSKIMEKGGQATCTITKLDTKETYDITVKGKKMKVSGIAMGEGAKKGFMITDTFYTYVWDESSKQGFKSKIPTDVETKNTKDDYSADKVAQTYDDESKYNINCKEGGVNDSDFTPPADVKFMDPSSLVPSDYLKNIPTVPAE